MKTAPDSAGDLAGLPYHLSDEVPAELDTDTGLRARHRRVPAQEQQPVAAVRTRGGAKARKWVPLYVIADAAPLPPLSAARQAAWDAVRRCSRCREVLLDPCPMNHRTGKRVCGRAKCWAATPADAQETDDA